MATGKEEHKYMRRVSKPMRSWAVDTANVSPWQVERAGIDAAKQGDDKSVAVEEDVQKIIDTIKSNDSED